MKFMDILLEAEGDKPTKLTPEKEGDDETTDYTADEAPEEPEEDNEGDQSEGDEDEDEDSTDYTAEEDESDPEEDGEPEETGDTTEEPAEDAEAPEEDTGITEKDIENQNNRRLLEDFIAMHEMVKTTIIKLNSIDKSNILINKVVTQITTNLNTLQKQLFDFIRFMFRKGKYVTNLYSYNYFLEAFKVNVGMLKKISIFVPNYQNN